MTAAVGRIWSAFLRGMRDSENGICRYRKGYTYGKKQTVAGGGNVRKDI